MSKILKAIGDTQRHSFQNVGQVNIGKRLRGELDKIIQD